MFGCKGIRVGDSGISAIKWSRCATFDHTKICVNLEISCYNENDERNLMIGYNGGYGVGVYGSGRTCRIIKAAGLRLILIMRKMFPR